MRVAFLTAGGIAPCLSASIGYLIQFYSNLRNDISFIGMSKTISKLQKVNNDTFLKVFEANLLQNNLKPENFDILWTQGGGHGQFSAIPLNMKNIPNIKGNNLVIPNFNNVTNTSLNTTISNEYGVNVSTIEHLMGAFYGMGIDNANVEIDEEEVPILDGSAKNFVAEILKVGIKSSNTPIKIIKIKSTFILKNSIGFEDIVVSIPFIQMHKNNRAVDHIK